MNKVWFLLLFFIFVSFCKSANIKNADIDLFALDFNKMSILELDTLICYINYISILKKLFNFLAQESIEQSSLILLYTSEINYLSYLNTRYLSSLMNYCLEKKINFLPKTDKLTSSNDHWILIQNIKSHKNKEDKLSSLLDIFSKLETFIKCTIEAYDFVSKIITNNEIKTYTKTLLTGLLSLINLKAKKFRELDNKRSKLKVLVEDKPSISESDISAHQLIGCCTDGNCESLETKNTKKKKRDRFERKRMKRNRKTQNTQFDYGKLESSNSKNDELPCELTEEKLNLFINTQNNEIAKSKLFSQRDKNMGILLKKKVRFIEKLIRLLSEISFLEIKLLKYIEKMKFLFDLLLIENNKNYDEFIKKRIKSIIKNQDLNNYFKYTLKDPKLCENTNLKLKNCLFACKMLNNNLMNDFCLHCRCEKCRAKVFESKLNFVD